MSSVNYASLISESGLPPEFFSSLQDTVVGFDYDVHCGIVSSQKSPFDLELETLRTPSNLGTLLICDLKLSRGKTTDEGVLFLKTLWESELSYHKSINQFDVYKDETGRDVLHALTLSPLIAMSVKFRIKK